VWAPKGHTPIVKVHPGRELTHFYGTLNLLTGEEVAQHGPTMNSETTAQHLQTLLAKFPDVPLLLFWDRAPWHRGPAIRQVLAAHPRLQTVFFPTAAPDLNPQEHVWKAVRTAVSHNHTETKLCELAQRFQKHLDETSFDYSFVEKYNFETLCARFK